MHGAKWRHIILSDSEMSCGRSRSWHMNIIFLWTKQHFHKSTTTFIYLKDKGFVFLPIASTLFNHLSFVLTQLACLVKNPKDFWCLWLVPSVTWPRKPICPKSVSPVHNAVPTIPCHISVCWQKGSGPLRLIPGSVKTPMTLSKGHFRKKKGKITTDMSGYSMVNDGEAIPLDIY